MAELTETIAEMARVLDSRLTAVAEQWDGISAQQTQMQGQFDNLTAKPFPTASPRGNPGRHTV